MIGGIELLKTKLKNNSGSAMLWVIFLVILISVFGIMTVNQIGNQFKSTTNRYEDIKSKYISEAGIERTIKEACTQLSNKIGETLSSNETLIKLVLENYTNTFNNSNSTYQYEVEYEDEDSNTLKQIEKDIKIYKENNKLTKVDDIEVCIISNTYKKTSIGASKLKYRIKSRVIFSVNVEDDLKVEYELKSYDRIPLK